MYDREGLMFSVVVSIFDCLFESINKEFCESSQRELATSRHKYLLQ